MIFTDIRANLLGYNTTKAEITCSSLVQFSVKNIDQISAWTQKDYKKRSKWIIAYYRHLQTNV